jgi:hypothetical protein
MNKTIIIFNFIKYFNQNFFKDRIINLILLNYQFKPNKLYKKRLKIKNYSQ